MVTSGNASSNSRMLRTSAPREPVDALVAVADDGDLLWPAASRSDDLVLGGVGVLVLVDEDVLEPLLVVREHVGVLAEQQHGVHQQVVEVHRAGLRRRAWYSA